MRRTGDLKLIQELNQFIVLDTIRQHGPISRSKISKKHQLSPTTVTAAVTKLRNVGLVTECGTGNSSGGRKPILIKFQPESYFLIGMSVRNSQITMAEMNLEATIRRKKQYTIHLNNNSNVTAIILNAIEDFLHDTGNLDECLGISVIIQGIANSDKGIIHYNPILQLKNVELKKIIEAKYNLKTWLDNDTNAFILAEKQFGDLAQINNLLYITVSDGVGAGILANGTIYRGLNGGAGEFGHTTIDRNGIPCTCGNRGCLENYVCWQAIHQNIKTKINSGSPSLMNELTNKNISTLTPRQFNQAINAGDSLAIKVLDEMISYLGVGVVNLVNLFNPDVIIFSGYITKETTIFIERLTSYITKYSLANLSDGLEVKSTTLGEDVEMVGAAAVLLQDFFKFSLTSHSEMRILQ